MISSEHRQPITYRHEIVVAADAIELEHVNNAVYLRWVQEAISAFWWRTAPSEYLGTVVWIAQRHEIVYHRPALLNERLTATLQVAEYGGARATFRTCFERGEEIIAETISTLVCADRNTRSLVRIRDDLESHFYRALR